jgi:hypothetical protein
MRAIQYGSLDVLELLPVGGIDIRMQNRERESDLVYAMNNGSCRGKRRLIKPQPGTVSKSATDAIDVCFPWPLAKVRKDDFGGYGWHASIRELRSVEVIGQPAGYDGPMLKVEST